MTTTEITPFTVTIDEAEIDDLRRRLEHTRFAPAAPVDLWDDGTPSSYRRDMVERWRGFDWREVEAQINAYPNYLTEIDGQTIRLRPREVGCARSPCAAPGPHLPRLVPRVPAARSAR